MSGNEPFPERRDERLRIGKLFLHVTDWGGATTDDCLVFAHPTGFLGAVWKPLLRRLRALGVTSRLISWDQRGHGLSSKPDDAYDWEHFITDAIELFDELAIRAAVGVGHSAGATTLAGVAAARPELLRRLVLVDPVLIPPELARAMRESGVPNPMASRTRTRRVVWHSREQMFRSYRHREPYETWTDEALHDYIDEGTFDRPDGEVELLCPARVESQIYSSASEMDGLEKVRHADLPVLFVRGERSTTFDEARARRAVEAAPRGRLVTVPGTTHFVPMEKPDEIARLLVAEAGEGA